MKGYEDCEAALRVRDVDWKWKWGIGFVLRLQYLL